MKPRIIITSILMLFMSSSISWGQEPINIDDLYEITQLSTTEHTIHGSVFEHFGDSVICPFEDQSCAFTIGGGLKIQSNDDKLLQKLSSQCREKVCTVTGTIFPKGKIPDNNFKIIEITSYSVGIEPNSKYVPEFLFFTLYGKPVFYEGNIDWGSNYLEMIYGVSKKYPYEYPKFDVSRLSEQEKLELSELHNNCSTARVTGLFYLDMIDGIMVDEFKCLDNGQDPINSIQDPINIDEIFDKTQLSASEYKVHGYVKTINGDPHLCPSEDRGCYFFERGVIQEITSKDKKLSQKLSIECDGTICTVTGTFFPRGKTDSVNKIIEITSYSVGVDPNSHSLLDLLNEKLNGKPVFYEGLLEWGKNYDRLYGISEKYPSEKHKFDVSYLSKEKKLEILDFHKNCTNARVMGTYFMEAVWYDGIIVNEFKCLD